jgi:hypothetical protein
MKKFKVVPGFPNYKIAKDSTIISNNRGKEIIKKPPRDSYNRPKIRLWLDGKKFTFKVSTVMAMTYLGYKKGCGLVVAHKDNIPYHNELKNLQLITQRLNASKDRKGKTSKYTGVWWHKRRQKWKSAIRINGIQKGLGFFINEEDAHEAYQRALREISVLTIKN